MLCSRIQATIESEAQSYLRTEGKNVGVTINQFIFLVNHGWKG